MEIPKYVQLTENLTRINSYLKEGVIFTKVEDDYEDTPRIRFSVYPQHGGTYISWEELQARPDIWREVKQSEIDELKINADEEQRILRCYTGSTWYGVWIEKPYRHFIHDTI